MFISFMGTVFPICCNVVCFTSSIQGLLLFLAGRIEFKRLSGFFSGSVFDFCSFTLDACRSPKWKSWMKEEEESWAE